MKYVRDATGRFRMRPHYEPPELDFECEKMITEFTQDLYGKLILPIPTDALTKLIERDADDLDLYADLSAEGQGVEGVTDFFLDRKPKVRIARELSEIPGHENRLRTTLTHEHGHVKFHAYLWQIEPPAQMFPELLRKASPKCKREAIMDAPARDWMEWQAGYICGATLMPVTYAKRYAQDFFEKRSLFGPTKDGSEPAVQLQAIIAERFGVSQDAARVRLIKLGFVTQSDLGPTLF